MINEYNVASWSQKKYPLCFLLCDYFVFLCIHKIYSDLLEYPPYITNILCIIDFTLTKLCPSVLGTWKVVYNKKYKGSERWLLLSFNLEHWRSIFVHLLILPSSSSKFRFGQVQKNYKATFTCQCDAHRTVRCASPFWIRLEMEM
jgi:hypothetical protein